MVQKDMGFHRWDVFDKGDDFDVNSQKNITESHCERYAKMLEEDPVEDGYKLLLSSLIRKLSKKPLKKRKQKTDNEEGTKDFAYGLWLKKLIEHSISYALEVERDGLPFLKYEGSVDGLDKECGFSGYKRKLRNGPRKNYGPFNERRFTSSEKDAEDSGRRKLKSVSRKNDRPLSESRFISSEEDGDSSPGKSRSGLGNNRGPSNESRFLVEEEAEDSSRGKLRSGLGKNSRPSDGSRITSSEEDADDLGRSKFRSESKKNNRPSNISRLASSEEDVEDSGRRNLRSGLKENNTPSNESRFTSSEEDAEDLGRRKSRNGPKQNNGPSDKSMYASSEEAEDSCPMKLRSGSKRNNRPSNKLRFTSSKEDVKDSGRRKLRSGRVKSEKMENGEISTCVTDPDYGVYLRNGECVEGWAVWEDGGDRTVFEKSNGGECNHQRDDEWGLFVEILDRDTYYKEANPGPSVEAVTHGLENMNKDNTNSNLSTQLEFRRQLIAVLRKPYDEEEYDKLWKDVKTQKQEKRHLDLRHGRERTCSTGKDGKSYLDHQPDLENQLLQLDDLENKPKRLNLLRGFFFWLKNASHNGSFHPWVDAECLAINPDSY